MEKHLLNYIEPYIFQDNKIMKKDFENLFGRFSKAELDEIYDFLDRNNIEINIEKNDGRLSNRDRDLNISNEELCRLYQEGNKHALDIIIENNERLVYSRVMRYYKMNRHGLSIDDLFQEGCIGMIKAVGRFNIDLGFKFSTYAINWIDQAIARSIADKGFTIRVPVHMFDNINKFNRIYKEMEIKESMDEDKLEALMKNTGFKLRQIKEINNVSSNILNISSLNIKVGEGEDTELISFLESSRSNNPIDEVTYAHLVARLKEALDSLTTRERNIIIYRFGLDKQEPRTLEEIGSMYDLTRERIRQIEKKALLKLRNPKRSKKLRAFLYEE